MWCFLLIFLVLAFLHFATLATVATYWASWMGQICWSHHIQALLHGLASFNFVFQSLLCCAVQRKVEKADDMLLNVQAHPIQNFNSHLGSKWQEFCWCARSICLAVSSLGGFFCKALSSPSHFHGANKCMALRHEWKLHWYSQVCAFNLFNCMSSLCFLLLRELGQNTCWQSRSEATVFQTLPQQSQGLKTRSRSWSSRVWSLSWNMS